MGLGASLLNLIWKSMTASAQAADCLVFDYLTAESNDSPFFEHYHQLRIPVAALIKPPAEGIVVTSSQVEDGSYDPKEFAGFIKSSGLSADALKVHNHAVKLTNSQLKDIAAGELVEVRVISKAGNYVHNFNLKASPAIMARVRRGKKA